MERASLSLVNEMFDAVEAGDVDRFRDCFAPDAVIWHNTDEAELGLDAATGIIAAAHQQARSWRYDGRRTLIIDNVVIVQHTLTATLLSGEPLRCPTMMRIEIAPSGRIARLEEYFDSRDTDGLGAIAGLSAE